MFFVPLAPQTRVSRQIECVSCKEIFTISEDEPNAKTPRFWQLAPDHYPDIQLRYQPNKTHRPVTPETRTHPEHMANGQPWVYNAHVYINCPRCGTDNRNWLHLTNINTNFPLNVRRDGYGPLISVGITAVLTAIAWFTLPTNEPLPRKIIFMVALILVGFLPIPLITNQWPKLRHHINIQTISLPTSWWRKIPPPQHTAATLLIASLLLMPIAFLLPRGFDYVSNRITPPSQPTLLERIDSLSGQFQSEQQVAPDKQVVINNVASSLRHSYEAFNLACGSTRVEAMITQLEAELTRSTQIQNRVVLIQNALNTMNSLKDLSGIACPRDMIENAIVSLQTLLQFDLSGCQAEPSLPTPVPLPQGPDCHSTLSTEMLITLRELQGRESLHTLQPASSEPLVEIKAVLPAIRLLIPQIEGNTASQGQILQDIEALETVAVSLQPASTKYASIQFITAWFKFAIVVSVVAIVFSLGAVNAYARKVNNYLPRPIFHSVSNLMRVVVWETKRSLEVPGDMNHIQWVCVMRNEKGGLFLQGIHREVLGQTTRSGNLNQRVRAQLYTIDTDMWGRIQSADVQTTTVQIAPESPSFLIEQSFFQQAATYRPQVVTTGTSQL